MSLHAPPHAFWRKAGCKEVLSPSIEEYRHLYNKESSASQNEGNLRISTYNHSNIKELFAKVPCKSSDRSSQTSSKRIKRKSHQLNEGTEKEMNLGKEILTEILREKHTLQENGSPFKPKLASAVTNFLQNESANDQH